MVKCVRCGKKAHEKGRTGKYTGEPLCNSCFHWFADEEEGQKTCRNCMYSNNIECWIYSAVSRARRTTDLAVGAMGLRCDAWRDERGRENGL